MHIQVCHAAQLGKRDNVNASSLSLEKQIDKVFFYVSTSRSVSFSCERLVQGDMTPGTSNSCQDRAHKLIHLLSKSPSANRVLQYSLVLHSSQTQIHTCSLKLKYSLCQLSFHCKRSVFFAICSKKD